MSNKDRVLQLLQDTGKAPQMFASTREAFLAHVCGVLLGSGSDIDVTAFYGRHLEKHGNRYTNLSAAVESQWAEEVIRDAVKDLHTMGLMRTQAIELEDFIVPQADWGTKTPPLEAQTLCNRETAQGVPTAVSYHPREKRWYVIQSTGQGPYVIWEEP